MKWCPFFGVFLIIVFGSMSFGQSTPVFEASFGYSFLRQEFNLNRHGWIASTAGNVNNWFGVKGEVGGSYTDRINSDVHSFLAGPQFTARVKPALAPWAHFLLGVTRTQRTSFPFFIGVPPVPPGQPVVGFLTATDSDFAIQPGGGIDFWLHPNFGIRFGGDYRRSFRGNRRNDLDYGRLHAGIVFRIGSK